MSAFLWSTRHAYGQTEWLIRKNFTPLIGRWVRPSFMGAPASETSCCVVYQWICRFGTRSRWAPHLRACGIAWMCVGMPGILAWFQCDRCGLEGMRSMQWAAGGLLIGGFSKQLVREPPCRSMLMLYLCLLLSQLARTSVDTTSGVVRDAAADALAEHPYMMDAFRKRHQSSCKPSEARLLSVDTIPCGKMFIMPSKEPRVFPCHKDSPGHYLLTSLWDEDR